MSNGGDQPDSLCMRCTRGSLNTHQPRHIPARILWPALGFPAVIAPGSASPVDDASTCVTVVILTKRRCITSAQAAEHLRFVPWANRHTRYLPPGTANGFTEDEIEMRHNYDAVCESKDKAKPRIDPHGIFRIIGDEFVQQIYFGHDAKEQNGFYAGLSKFVLKKYKEWGFEYLHEIHLSRAASSRLAAGKYNLFWINSDPDTEDIVSDEMSVLLENWAKPTRKRLMESLSERFEDDPKKMSDFETFLLAEYEYDFGALHAPYNGGTPQPKDPWMRTEILHPLFVRDAANQIKIGHITDLHVDVRSDVYEDNLKKAGVDVDFNNWNKAVTKLYTKAKQSCDVLLLTGDLIDYGRGHIGIPNNEKLGDDNAYHADRNWFLFYYLLASGTSYEKPSYTILGNHDWRLNPYPPFAIAGAPDPKALINDYQRFKPQNAGSDKDAEQALGKKLKEIMMKAHGPDADRAFSYYIEATGVLELAKQEPEEFYRTLWRLLKQTQTMNVDHAPTETKVESIAWYLLLINPFLDYAFHLPGGYDVLMLDWAEYEDVLFPLVIDGEEWYFLPTEAAAAAAAGPKAKACLTDPQKRLVEDFVGMPGKAKVLCIHAPPIGPYPAWTNDRLYAGKVEHDNDTKLPGSKHYKTIYPDGTSKSWFGHPIYALRPKDGPYGQEADYGSFQKHRDWLITELRKDTAHVRMVLSGHIHRNGLFVVHVPAGDPKDSVVAGQLMTKMVPPQAAAAASPPAVTRTPEGDHGPLYVNTTSAGPRGHLYYDPKKIDIYVDSGYSEIDFSNDGTIQKIEFLTAKGLSIRYDDGEPIGDVAFASSGGGSGTG